MKRCTECGCHIVQDAPIPEAVERVARAIYETGERLRADDDIPGSPWTPWNRQTSHRERRIVYEQARAAIAAMRGEGADRT